MYHMPYLDGEPRESYSTKCTVEKEMTEHVFIRVQPENPEADPMEILTLAKRLVLCTNCGNLRLIN